MKTKRTLFTLVLVLYSLTKANAYSFPDKFWHPSSNKSKKLDRKVNSGEFSLRSFAFTENKGQIFGYDGLPHPEVKFCFQQGTTQMFLLENGIAYQFTKVHYPEGYQESIHNVGNKLDFQRIDKLQKQIRIETFRMDMTLLGANKYARITTEDKSADHTNFYQQNVFNVHCYSKIIYHNIYPGIDWVIYTQNHQIKYDFVIHPGSDPSLIRMEFTDQEDLMLNKDGSFTLKNSLGNVTEKAPFSFQGAKTIKTRFQLKNKTLSFALEKFDPKEALVIDPAINWATYYGGTGDDDGTSCATDALGNVYLVGITNSMMNIASGGHQNTMAGNADAFLVKFNSHGIRQWGSYYGGNSNDYIWSCATDPAGNCYVAGFTESTSGISFGGHQNNYGGGSSDAFLVKFNSNGVRQWGSYYGGTGHDDWGWFCTTDASGNIYLAGVTTSTTNIASGGHQNNYGGGTNDAYLVKFNSSGVRLWGTYYGGFNDESGNSCAIDSSGDVYLVGSTNSTNNIASGGHQNIYGGGTHDAFLVKFNSSGVRQWGSYYGGSSGLETALFCATDAWGNAYITGYTTSGNSIASGGHQNNHGGGPHDAFLVKFNGSGVRQWGTYYGGIGLEQSSSCATDAMGNVYLVGKTTSTNSIAFGGFQNANAGLWDSFIVKFNSAGVRQWGSYFGGSENEWTAPSCAIDTFGNLFFVGSTSSTISIASGGHQNVYSGPDDAFLVKLCTAPPSQPTSIIGNTLVCFGSSQSYVVMDNLDATLYSWALPGGWIGFSSTNTIALTAGSSGVFSVTALNGCGASSMITLTVMVNPGPTVSISGAIGTICAGESVTLGASGAVTYTWSNGSNGISLVISPSITSTYSIIGTDSLGCINTSSFTQNVDVCLGVDQFAEDVNDSMIYPNPNYGEFFIKTDQRIDIRIFNQFGQLIYSKQLEGGVNKMDLRNYSNGVYLFQVIYGDELKKIYWVKQ